MPGGREPRLAAGRARALGLPTRGTTNPNRLRRMDNWIVARLGGVLRAAADPLVVDLGYGATPVTTVELSNRLRRLRPDVRVLGLEIDPDRVDTAQVAADPPLLAFTRGGFELAGRRPLLVRAANVLRQYDEDAAGRAWQTLRENVDPAGVIVEGTCDEVGRLASWVLLDRSGPRSLTLACRVDDISRPSELAARLPKALIHRNVAGERIHDFLESFDERWHSAAPLAVFGAHQRWIESVARLRADGWPVDTARSRHGEVTVKWAAVAPPGG